ncbi:MAG: glycosyltransferase family 4 protein, partial [Gammaproteobacteria bacterium]|nr:glycosyltransferase family 4 protein [Gammaproteobacteria bacterium]
MNILFVHEIDWLEKVVFEVHCFSEFLSLLGHKVIVIDYCSKGTGTKFPIFGNLSTEEKKGINRAYKGATVSLRRPGSVNIKALRRLSAFITHYLEIKKTIEENSIDVVVLYSVPTNGLQTIYLAKKHKIPVVFRSIDIFHKLVPYSILRPITKLMEKEVYSRVDLVLALTTQLGNYVVGMGADANKVRVLSEGVDTELFHPDKIQTYPEIMAKHDISSQDKVVLFIGTFFEFSGLDQFILEFPKIIERVPDAKLLIVGDGGQRDQLEDLIKRLHLGHKVIITGFQPYDSLVGYINLAALCINPFRIVKASRDVIPAKILQYLACGKPVIATPLPGMKEPFPSEREGVIYADDSNDMANKVVSLLQSPQRRNRIGEAGLKNVREKHSYNSIVREFERIL